MAWWDSWLDWIDNEEAPARPVQGPPSRPAAAPVDPEAQRAQQLIQRWRQQAAPTTAPTVAPARDPLEAALSQWQQGPKTPPVQGPAPRPTTAPVNPWQAAVDEWQAPTQQGPQPRPPTPPTNPWAAAVDSWRQPKPNPIAPIMYDTSAPTIDYALDRPDTGAAPIGASTTIGGQTQRSPIAPSLRAYGGPADEDYYASNKPPAWGPRPLGGNNLAVADAGAAVGSAQMLGSGINAILNSDAIPGEGMLDKAGNLIGGAFAGAKGWFDNTAAGERFAYDVDQRAAERAKNAGRGWGDWASDAGENIAGAWGGLRDAMARQTLGEGNVGEIAGGVLGSILTPVGELLNISQPTQIVKDTALNVASGLQAGQDLMNAIPMGEGNLPLGTAIRSGADAALEAATGDAPMMAMGGKPIEAAQKLWSDFTQTYWNTQQKFQEALTPTAEQAQAQTSAEIAKNQQRALLNWADPESVAKTFDALVDQKPQVQALTAEAQRLYDAGANAPDEETRQELWAQAADKGAEAYKLENTHPVALVNENTNIWAQMAFELVQPDLTDIAGGALSLLQLTPKARRLTSTAEDVLRGADNAADELSALALGPQTRAAMLAETSDYNPRNLLDPRAWGTTGQAQAHQATDALQRVLGNVLTDIDTAGDAKLVMRQLAEDPSKLITGMAANLFQSDGLLQRATQDGLVRFGAMNMQNLKEPLRIWQQAAQTFLENSESLNKGGPLLNKVDFATEFVDAMNEAGYKFFNVAKAGGGAQASAVGELGKKFRSVVSPFYIYLSPGTWATNIIGGVSTALGDGTLAGGLVRNMDAHLTKLFGADPTVRGLEGAVGSMTQAAQAGGETGLLAPLRKAYSAIEENMSKRVYYAGTTHALKKVGRDILNNTLTPILTANGVTDPKLIRQAADHLFEVGYSGGNLINEFGKLLNGQTRVFSLSNVNPNWMDALSPDVLDEFYTVIRTAGSKEDALTKLDTWVDKASKYWDNLIAEAPTVPQRHVWQQQEVVQDTADLAQIGKQAQKYAGIPEADITAWKQATAAAMDETKRRMQTLMEVVADSANPQNRYALYNVWGALQDMTGSVRARLGELAETAAQAPLAERGQRWGEYWTEAQKLWSGRNTQANDLLEKSAAAIAAGEDFAPNLRTWDVLERTAAQNEAKLWDTLRLEPQSGAYDTRLAQVIEAGRGIADKAVARTYAAARRFVEVDAMDYIISAERNVQMAGAQARAYLDTVLEKSLKSGDWKSYYEIRNEVWRQLRSYERDTWGLATRSIVSDGLAKETTTGLRFDTGFDGVVELIRPEQRTVQRTSRLGAEKTVTQQEITDWVVRREDGTYTRYADAQVPQELKDKYRGVTPDEIDAQVQTELDNIASAQPFAPDMEELLNAPTPPIRLVEPAPQGVGGILRENGTDTQVKILGQGKGGNYRYQLPDGTVGEAPMDSLMITGKDGKRYNLRSVQQMQQAEGDIARAQEMIGGAGDARSALREEWDRIAKAEGGYSSIDQAIATYTRQGIVNVPENKFEDLYGKTIAGRTINNQDDVNALLQEYYNLNAKAKSATAKAKVAREEVKAAKAPAQIYQPSQQQIDQVRTSVQKAVERSAQRNKLTPAQVEDYVTQALKQLSQNDVVVSVPPNVVDNILSDGRIKTQFETGTSQATASKTMRADAELKGLGIPENIPADQRPVYGYLNFSPETRNLTQRGYGDITFVLSDSVRSRTTIGVGDTMDNFRRGNMVGAPIDNPNILAADHEVSNLVDYAKTGDSKEFVYSGTGYVEAHIQGGVRLDDIKAVLDEKGVLTPAQVQQLQAQGIQVLQGDAAQVYGKLPERAAAAPPTVPTIAPTVETAPATKVTTEQVKRDLNLGNAANQTDAQKVTQVTSKNTTAAGGAQAPEMALAAMHAKEQLTNIYNYVRANLDDILTPKGAIGQGQNLRALDDFRRTVVPAWDNAKAVAAEYGNRMRSFTMVDFANNTRLDEIASLFFPYSFWFTRSIKNSAERMVFEPHIWRRVMQTENYIRDMREQRGDPARFDGAIPIDMGNGTTYYLRVSPAKYWPTFGLFTANDYADPESANNAYSMALESLKAANFAPFPWMQAAGQVASNLIDGKPATYDMYPTSYLPQGRLIGWTAAKLMGHNIPGFLRPGYYEYNVARELTTMVTEGRITSEQAQWAQDMLRQMKTGEAALPEQAAMGQQLTAILDEATKRAADKELTSAGSSFATGFSLRPYDQDEGTALQASQTYRQREYNALTNPYGSEAAQNYTFEQYPELGPKYSQYGVMDADQTRPGASAAKSAKMEETKAARDGLYGAGDQAVDAMLQANPNATRDDIYQARRNAIIENAGQYTDKAALDAYLAANPDASYVDVVKFVTDAIEQKYPSADLVQAGNGQKSYNPVEQKENFQASVLKQAPLLFPYPQYPGDGATAAEKAAYFKAKEEADRQRQAWITEQLTTGGQQQLMPNWMKGSTALDNTALTVSPGEAAALIQEDKTKYQTEAEQARLAEINQENEQKRRAGSAKQQEFLARRANVEGYFGAGGAAMWDEYYALPKGAAREEFIRNNPTMRAINLYAYNKAELAPALEMFGDDAFGKWALAPAYADTPEAKAARSKYWDANPKAFLFNSWLNGRPGAAGESDQVEGFRYNFGADYATAREMFGDNIWDTVAQYQRGWNKAQKRAWFDAHPEYKAWADWWYGNLPKEEGAGRSYGGGGGGGGGGYAPYQRQERPLVVDIQDVYGQGLSRELADVAPARGFQPARTDLDWLRTGQELRPGKVRDWSPEWIRAIKK